MKNWRAQRTNGEIVFDTFNNILMFTNRTLGLVDVYLQSRDGCGVGGEGGGAQVASQQGV